MREDVIGRANVEDTPERGGNGGAQRYVRDAPDRWTTSLSSQPAGSPRDPECVRLTTPLKIDPG
jgi:hypothetical protein